MDKAATSWLTQSCDKTPSVDACVLNSASHGMFLTDSNDKCVWTNDAFKQLTGYSVTEISGKEISGLFESAPNKNIITDIQVAMSRDTTFCGEILTRRKDGILFWADITIDLHRDSARAVVGHLAVLRDITVRKEEQDALASILARHEHTEELSGIGGWTYDLESGKVTWSRGLCLIHGIDPHDQGAIDKYQERLWAEPDPHQAAALQRAIEEGRSFELEAPYISASGRNIWTHVRGEAVVRDGKTVRVVGHVQDITARKKHEHQTERLIEAMERTEEIASIGGWYQDLRTEEITWTYGSYLIHDLDPSDQVAFKRYAAELAIGRTAEHKAAVAGTVGFGKPYDLTVPRITAKGRDIWVHTRGEAVHRDAKIVGIAGHIQDVTAQRLLELEVKRQEERLRESLLATVQQARAASEAKSQFLAMMSHELRTPMTGVLGMTDLLLQSGLNDEQRLLTTTMQRSANSLLSILNDILDFSKIEANQLQLDRAPFSVVRVMQDVESLLSPIAAKKGIKFSAKTEHSHNYRLMGDENRLRQVVVNLVGNAIKFTEKGEVAVSAGLRPSAVNRATLTVIVRDTGIGMSQKTIEQLFKPFQQSDSGISRKFGGTGLGLAISQSFVNAMGGKIVVSSVIGEGSTFSFEVTLDVAASDNDAVTLQLYEASTSSEETASIDGNMPLKILLAEDDDTVRFLIVSMLSRLGHDVDAVQDGALAVAAASENSYDLLLMDMQMPVMNGPQAVRAIREGESYFATPQSKSRTPVIGLTADVLPTSHASFLDSGADVVLTKPINWGALSREMRRLCDASSSQQTAINDSPIGPTCNTGEVSAPASLTEGLPTEDLINEAMLTELREAVGATTLNRILRTFDSGIADYGQTLEAAINAKELSNVRSIAHALKGTSYQFGATRLGNFAKDIEKRSIDLLSGGDSMAIDLVSTLPQLCEVIRDTQKALRSRGGQ